MWAVRRLPVPFALPGIPALSCGHMESISPLTKLLTRAEFYAFAEKIFDLPEVKGLLMEAVNEHNRAEQKEGC